ncbi:MAG: amidohydrolase family protein [Ectothiorhodospiraceae bacterium]|nr:amidohydrolase family protein [Ectothiorhodospiraceae bacterium]
MAFDLLIQRARLAGGDGVPVDIGVAGGLIVALAPGLPASGEVIDADGRVVSPGLIETHIHLDKSRIVDRCAPASGRARDHMKRVAAVKPGFTVEDVYARARATLEGCLLHGTTHMRTHVEVDPNVGLVGFEALRELARDYRWGIDLELCVFAQEGLTDTPEADRNMVAALRDGATVVGGAPGYDPDRPGQIRRIFELAREFDVDVDIHLDVGPTAEELDVLLVCELADAMGWGGRVTVGHGTKYSCLPPDELARLGRRLADSGVAVTVLPATDLFITGRHLDHDVVRGVADANALRACGVRCSLSTNNVLNPFTPFGDCSLVRVANLYAHTVQRGNDDELAECFEMLTRQSAAILRREDYGIAVGHPADLVLWDARTSAEVVATNAIALAGFKRGRRTFTRERAVLHRP